MTDTSQFTQDFAHLRQKHICFIGGGNMTKAIIGGLIKANDTHQLGMSLSVCDKNPPKLDAFSQDGVTARLPDDAKDIIMSADVVVLSIKPQALKEFATSSLAPMLDAKLIISVLAGVTVDGLTRSLGTARVVRAMPNLPASVGQGATGLYANHDSVSDADRAISQSVMSSVGITAWLDDESHMHAITAISGSSPAYFFYVLEVMIQAGVEMGLPKTLAHAFAVMSMQGAATLSHDADVSHLKNQVTSKGGTTIKALETLEHRQVGRAFREAMMACAKRSDELSRLLDE